MDTLRNTLEIIFKEMTVEPLLKDMVHLPFFNSERFVRLYQHRSPNLSLDQCRLHARMVERYYMLPPEEIPGAQHASVFNVLLHFNQKVLREYEERPVCKFEHLLSWNSLSSLIGEDLLTTSFLASNDIRNAKTRSRFDWGLVIDQDDPDLRELFRHKMADVHMHLKGSSSNFDLNWLCLMNHPKGREKEYRKLLSLQHPLQMVSFNEQFGLSFHALAIKACAIRYLLYLNYVRRTEVIHQLDLMLAINADCDVTTKIQASALETIIAAERLSSNSQHTMFGHDYIGQVDEEMVKCNPNCIIAGERRFLYECFRAIYSGDMTERDSSFLYAYILIKNLIRNELIQSNGVIGFDNFNSYENRKTLFIDHYPLYERLVGPLALGQYFYQGKDRCVEPRITPKDSPKKIHDAIYKLDQDFERLTFANVNDYRYVLHFIKQKDQRPKSGLLHPRHHKLRGLVQKQANAIYGFCKDSRLGNRIAGIDAANSEIYARPEVFAQAFRFLRDTPVFYDGNDTKNLGMTYHVGEDFLSIIDGLRAIDEVIHFLRFRRGDRLGHALVLCVDPVRYLSSRHNTLLLPKMLVLDDIAWGLNKSEEGSCIAALRAPLEHIFYRVFREVYGDKFTISLRDYYESWLLRGDNPARYEHFHSGGADFSYQVSQWSNFDLNDDSDAVFARKNSLACELYYNYHYNLGVRNRGEEIMELHCPDGTARLITDLQQQALKQLGEMNIGIETNPTSNVRIGGFGRYRDLPVMKFVPLDHSLMQLSTSVNTDDRGVFATSIEREYALLACAIAKSDDEDFQCSMSEIYAWLDKIRHNGLVQRF